jgi:hypothetical protein
MRTFLAIASAAIFVALAACGKQTLPQKPQLTLDRCSIGFAQEFGSGTFIGTRPQESIIIENGGLTDLVISGVTTSGADPSAFEVTGPTKTTLKGLERAYLRVVFAPTEARCYSMDMNLASNAENAPNAIIRVSGRGVTPGTDGGFVACPPRPECGF